jgi:hypothetical protein
MSAAVKERQEIQVAPSTVPAMSEGAALVQMIDRAARDPNVDIGKMRELLAMRKEIGAEQAAEAFNAAMTKAQSEIASIVRDADNSQTKSRYATYAALDKATRPIYTRHQFALNFNTADGAPENHVRIVCDVTHGSHTRRYQLDMPADGKGAKGGDVMTKTHAVKSAMTYGRGTLLAMIFNLSFVDDDDDGNAAGAGEKIMEDQVATLRAMIAEVSADEAKFCKFLKVERVEDLPVARWGNAVSALEAKRAKS